MTLPTDEEKEVPNFIFNNLLPDDINSFFRYEGSLTTPTCNEIVIWTVLTKTIPISSKQVRQKQTFMFKRPNKRRKF